MVMDDHTVAESGRSACKDAGRIIVSVLVLLLLIRIVHTGHELATKTRRYDGDYHGSADSYIALVFGVATVGFGMLYFIIALIILAELAFDLLGWLRPQYIGITNSEEKEEKTICQVCIQGSAVIVSMFMLTWAIYHGCKLASDAPKGGVYPCLVFVVGFTTMAFGFINFIIGISVVAESALYLSGRLQQAVLSTSIHEDGKSDTLLDV